MKDGWATLKPMPVRLPAKPYFISTERAAVQKLINLLEQYAVAVEWFNANTKTATKMAVTLDSLIREEYHLN
jgi:hypothetical protein